MELPSQIFLVVPEDLLKNSLGTPCEYIIFGNFTVWNEKVGILGVKSKCSFDELNTLDFTENTKIIGLLKFYNNRASEYYCRDILNRAITNSSKLPNDVMAMINVGLIHSNKNEYIVVSRLYDNELNTLVFQKVGIIIYSSHKRQISNLGSMLEDANRYLCNTINLIEEEKIKRNSVFFDTKHDVDNGELTLFKYCEMLMKENEVGTTINNTTFDKKTNHKIEPFFLQIFMNLIFYTMIGLSLISSLVWSGVSNFPVVQTLIQKNICATISQLAFKIKNQRNWIILDYMMKSADIKSNIRLHNSIQILLYSSITTIFVDYVFGIIFALGIDAFSEELIILMEKSFFYIYHDAIHTQVKWLMSFPAGFKLNQNLTTLIGNLTLAALKFWCDLTSQHFSDLNHNMIFLIKFASIACGMSVAVALIWDILNIYSFLLFFIYTIMAKLYNLNLKAIKTFFYIFRGIKSNIFSNIDHNSHYSEQLLIGTILFTIFVLILPTITAFYINFLFIWSCVYVALLFLFFTISIINTFPFYLILVNIFQPNSYSSGVFLREFFTNSSDQSILIFSYKKLGMNSICKPFSESLGHLLKIHLNIIQIIRSIISGNILHILNLQGYKVHHFRSTFISVCKKEVVEGMNCEKNTKNKPCLSNGNFHHYSFDSITLSQLYNLIA
ncbi:N-acetylglucosaminyl-phosphatidylinositol transferase involved in GIP anchor biosynthesis [Cryptosporidium xiaoi]|uniref:N-acetylglucosaminyl-phosphatidylinositol transferase involved in GIP anchor biosynthesis n=1 Tax=Cryptosporidium xiaoi TaxID=659607 RepID=A0AAV9XVV0_9CRYT